MNNRNRLGIAHKKERKRNNGISSAKANFYMLYSIIIPEDPYSPENKKQSGSSSDCSSHPSADRMNGIGKLPLTARRPRESRHLTII